jgi:hypothetical protein
MQDPQYRNQVAGQNVSYNQPPHASFYLGSDQPLPSRPDVTVLNGGTKPIVPTEPELETATLVDGSVFMIQNVNSGLYLEVANGLAEAGANVQQWGANETGAWNTWRVISAGDGYYYLYSQLGDTVTYLLDLDYGSTADGTNIQIFTDTKADAQLFKFIKNDDGSYYILTKSSSDKSAITVADSSTSSGANIVQSTLTQSDAQKWTLTEVQPSGNTIDTSYTYMIKNVNSGLYLEVKNGLAEEGANVQQWEYNGPGDWNTWKLVSAGNGYYYFYSLLGGGDSLLLDVTDGKAAAGTNVQIANANNTSSQLFKLVANPDGSYNIVTKASKDNCALDVDANSTEMGANISQYTSKNSSNQQWILEKVSLIEDNVVGDVIGDVNSDGSVTYLDVLELKKVLLGISSTDSGLNYDVDGNTLINIKDLITLKSILLK